jgi:hypothetical protein
MSENPVFRCTLRLINILFVVNGGSVAEHQLTIRIKMITLREMGRL